MSKPLILVTNDDGISSKGIRLLTEIASHFGKVVVVAPDKAQSAMGHAITVSQPLHLKKSFLFDDLGIEAYACSGTPADCVKIAHNVVFDNQKPDLVLSGVNHGSNTSISVLYSGTMAAAIEAALKGISSIGFSYCDYNQNLSVDHLAEYIQQIIDETLQKKLPKNVALNVNFPANTQDIKGIKVCRQAKASWEEHFDLRANPFGAEYYWLAGDFVNEEDAKDTDEWAIANNYVAVVPCMYDLTAYKAIDDLHKNWSFGE